MNTVEPSIDFNVLTLLVASRFIIQIHVRITSHVWLLDDFVRSPNSTLIRDQVRQIATYYVCTMHHKSIKQFNMDFTTI